MGWGGGEQARPAACHKISLPDFVLCSRCVSSPAGMWVLVITRPLRVRVSAGQPAALRMVSDVLGLSWGLVVPGNLQASSPDPALLSFLHLKTTCKKNPSYYQLCH